MSEIGENFSFSFFFLLSFISFSVRLYLQTKNHSGWLFAIVSMYRIACNVEEDVVSRRRKNAFDFLFSIDGVNSMFSLFNVY